MNVVESREGKEWAKLVKLRRLFHRNPEPGFAEFWTTAKILEHLEGLNCRLLYGKALKNSLPEQTAPAEDKRQAAYERAKEKFDDLPWMEKLAATTGVVAVISGAKPGPKIGFRFDIDGLPIAESRENHHFPYREGFHSTNGCMHACGHDGHITLGLGLAQRLSAASEQLAGEYYLLFQPAEELIAGGKLFSRLSFIKELNYFLPVHLGLTNERKIICGLSFLADKTYRVLFQGRAAHAAANPESGKNALLAACHAVSALYGMARSSKGATRINVGRFTSDNAVNVISDKVQFELDVRGESNAIRDDLVRKAENILQGASLMHDARHEMALLAEAVTADNAGALVTQVKKACLAIGIPPEEIVENALIPVSEDATYIMNEVSLNGGLSTYVCIGCPTYGGHHNETFDFDEEILSTGVRLLYQLAARLSKIEMD